MRNNGSILKQAEAGVPVPDLCREHGMSSATFYTWRSKYGGMDPMFRNKVMNKIPSRVFLGN